MGECDAPRVQRLARDRRGLRAVNAIADDRPSARGQVYPDLMGSAGQQLATDDRDRVNSFESPIDDFVDGLAWRTIVTDHDEAAIGRRSSEPEGYPTGWGIGDATHDGEVLLPDPPSRHVALHRRVKCRGQCDDDDP